MSPPAMRVNGFTDFENGSEVAAHLLFSGGNSQKIPSRIGHFFSFRVDDFAVLDADDCGLEWAEIV